MSYANSFQDAKFATSLSPKAQNPTQNTSFAPVIPDLKNSEASNSPYAQKNTRFQSTLFQEYKQSQAEYLLLTALNMKDNSNHGVKELH